MNFKSQNHPSIWIEKILVLTTLPRVNYEDIIECFHCYHAEHRAGDNLKDVVNANDCGQIVGFSIFHKVRPNSEEGKVGDENSQKRKRRLDQKPRIDEFI